MGSQPELRANHRALRGHRKGRQREKVKYNCESLAGQRCHRIHMVYKQEAG